MPRLRDQSDEEARQEAESLRERRRKASAEDAPYRARLENGPYHIRSKAEWRAFLEAMVFDEMWDQFWGLPWYRRILVRWGLLPMPRVSVEQLELKYPYGGIEREISDKEVESEQDGSSRG